MDFTIKTFTNLLDGIKRNGYSFQTFRDFLEKPAARAVILRHDVDKMPSRALVLAEAESRRDACGTYYFRILEETFHKEIIQKIAGLGHEIGYHYEDLSMARGDQEKAIALFTKNLSVLRDLVPVTTICMHGTPLSKWDNRQMWQKISYKKFGIIGEPYLDLDFNQVLYLTDTGRTWKKTKGNVRDIVESDYSFQFKTTFDIVSAFEEGRLPNHVMITIHPHRWTDEFLLWCRELIVQNLKNVIKNILRNLRNEH